jgi:hypothetical protein
MSRIYRNLILLLAVALSLAVRGFAVDTSITVSGSETQASGTWDTAAITISFSDSASHSYSETVAYGQFSTSASIASAFGAKFSNDYLAAGQLCAHAVGTVIYFHLKGALTFGSPTIGNPSVSFVLTPTSWVVQPVAPSITTQPTSQTVAVGNTATFSVTATGTPTLTYAWQYLSGGTWLPFGGGTGYNTASLTTIAATGAYNGVQLRVVVTDGNGLTTTSNVVTLTVNSPQGICGA